MTIEILGDTEPCSDCHGESTRALGNKYEKVTFVACDTIFRSATWRRDGDAIACLIECIQPWLMKWGVRHYRLDQAAAEDCAQDASIALMLRLKRQDLPPLYGGYGDFLGYARTTMFHVKINHFHRSHQEGPIEGDDTPEPPDPRAIDEFERGEKIRLASALLDSLENPFERELVRFRHVHGLSIDEIIRILKPKMPGLDKPQVFRALESALRKLRRHALVREQIGSNA